MVNKSVLILLYLLGVGAASLAAIGQTSPGYMDADYYYGMGMQLANGNGFNEPFLWNYLDDPAGLPHPSHLYWMPLASVIAAAGMAVTGSTKFLSAQIPFILLSGFIPVISAQLSTVFLKNKKYYWIAGLLGVFPGLYVIYLAIPETFVLYLVMGGLFWLLILKIDWIALPETRMVMSAGLLGITAGLMHLSRADGILWAAGGGAWLIYVLLRRRKFRKFRIAIISLLIFTLGYSLIMGAWYARNIELFGWLMPPGNNRTLWLTNYNQTFYFPADSLTLRNWLDAGLLVHLQAWWMAFKMNLKNLVAVQGLVIQLPLMTAGLWVNRKNPGLYYAKILWMVTFLVMTLVFPYQGARGGYLHAASAFQCLLWAAVPAGLEEFTAWGERKRNWTPAKAVPMFAILLIVVSAMLTGWFYVQKVVGDGSPENSWGYEYETYKNITEKMKPDQVGKDDLFMVNNPPGFFIATGYSAIVIPGGGTDQTQAAAAHYGATYLIIESGQENLRDLYTSPHDFGTFQYLEDIDTARIFCFDCE